MPQSRLVYDHTETSHGDGSRKEAITSHGMQDKESEGTLHDKANGKEEGPDNGGQSDAGYKRVNQALGARRPLVTRMDHDHNDVDDNTETDDEIPTKPTRRSDRRFGTKRAITLTMDHPSNNSMDDGDYHDSEEGEEEEEDTDTDEELPRRRKRIADTRIHLLVEQAKENKPTPPTFLPLYQKIVSTKAQDMSNSNNTTHLAGPAQGIGTGSCSQRRSVPTGSSSGDNKNNSSRTSTGTSDCNNHLGRLVQEIIVDTLHRDPYIQEAARMLGITGRQEEEEEEEDHQAAVQSVYHRKKQQPIFQFMILDQDFDNWLQYHSDEISCQFIRKRREREIKQSRRQGQVTYEHRCHKQGSAPVKPQGSKNTRSSKKSNCKSTITSCTMDMIPTCPPRSSTSTTTTTTTTTAGRENARDQHRQGHVVIKVRRIRYNYCHNHPLKRPENLRDMRKSPLLRNKIQRLVERGKTIQQVLELLAPESQDVVSVDPSTSDTSSSSDSNKNHPPSSNAPLKRDNVVTYDDVYHVYYKALRTLSQKADDDRESCRLWMAELEGQGYLTNKTQLYTIVVKHDRGFGIPVAYLLTKKSDLQVLSGWLKKLAMRMGESFKPSVIVTDQGSVEMKAIKSAFSQCKIVFCTGHTLRSWKQNHHERGVSTTEREKASPLEDRGEDQVEVKEDCHLILLLLTVVLDGYRFRKT
ncbi:hypothetical protein BGX31_010245 [Mortierella sp. GBA43]|nr:hypothetical protein BGX31_010245 [Mortierella sp. GBA43]